MIPIPFSIYIAAYSCTPISIITKRHRIAMTHFLVKRVPYLNFDQCSLWAIQPKYRIFGVPCTARWPYAEIWYRHRRVRHQVTGLPGSFSEVVITRRPSRSSDIRIIPWLSVPIIGLGFKLATTITFFPSICSGV